MSFYGKNAIIQPDVIQDRKESSNSKKSFRYLIDSKSRDKSRYPNPSHYKIPLHYDLTNVVSVELVSADVPFPFYLIRSGKDSMRLDEGNGPIDVVLEHGDYSSIELAQEVESSLNRHGKATYTVVYDSRKKLYVFSSDLLDKDNGSSVSFCLDGSYIKNSCASILGFDEKKYISNPSGIIISPFMADLRKDSFIALKLSGAKAIQSIESGIHETFAIIPDNFNNTNMRSFAPSARNIKYFNPIRADIKDLELRFIGRDGDEVDFQNQDHVIELVFEIYIQELSYGNIYL